MRDFLRASQEDEDRRLREATRRMYKIIAGLAVALIAVTMLAFVARGQRDLAWSAEQREREAMGLEIKARKEAEVSRDAAQRAAENERKAREAEKTQREVAEQQTVIAQKQRHEAVKQQHRAEEQTQIAEERRQEAEKQRKAAEEARDEAAYQLAETLADRAEEQSAPGKDIVQAFHLANRAAMVSPAGRPETSLHVARVLHMAASLPRVLDLEKTDAGLLSGSLDGDLRHLLAMTGDYKLGFWDIQTGRRAPLPFDPDTKVGRAADLTTGDGYVKWDFLEFSPDGSLAKAVFNDDTAGAQTLWVWKAATGEKLAEVQLEDTHDEFAFSAEGTAVISKRYYCPDKEAKEAERGHCCRQLLAPACRAGRAVHRHEGDEDKGRQLTYRGRRPVLVEDRNDHYGGQYQEQEGERWVALGMSRDQKTIAAISKNGQVSFWDNGAEPLVRKWNLPQRPLAARIVGDGSSILMLTRDGRLVQQKFEGSQVWSAPVAGRTEGTEFKGGAIWDTSKPDTFLVTYRLEERDDYGVAGWLDLWKVGEAQPRKHMPFSGGPVSDLTLLPDESGGIAEIWGEEEHNYLHGWSFSSKRSQRVEDMKMLGTVVKGFDLGITRDGKVLLEGDERELRFLDPVSREPAFAPFAFSVERGISGKAVAAILHQAHDLRATARGVAATLLSGQPAELYRDKVGARFEVGGKLVRGTVAESGHVLSPDGRLMCGIHSYSSGGGRIGSMQDLVVREVETGRIIAGHYRLSASRIVGFTPGNSAVLVQGYDGELFELYVHGGHRKAPDCYSEIGPSLTGVRLLPNLGLSSLPADEYKNSRDKFKRQMEASPTESEEAKRLILSHLPDN